MDTLAAQAAEADRLARGITGAELAAGFNHLARLRHGGEPDYEQRGLGTAYLLYYAVRRAGVIAAALAGQQLAAGPVRVLDIGSGTDAVSLALSATFPEVRFTIDAVEPSREMAAAGRSLTDLLPLTVRHYRGWMEDALGGAVVPGNQYDLVFMSAVLPYGWEIADNVDKVLVGDQIERRLVPGGRLIVLEPRAKRKELAILQTALARTNVHSRTMDVEPPDEIASLPRSTRLLRQWLAQTGIRGYLEPEGVSLNLSASETGLRMLIADIVLHGTRSIGPSPSQKQSECPAPTYTRLPRTRSRRPRVTTQVSRRTWLLAAALAATATTLAAALSLAIL